jgi:nucleoside-diphosphate-sugar epimerase
LIKIAVTGATGFIGRHVLKRLSKENVSIVAAGRDRSKWNGIGEFIELDINSIDGHSYQYLGRPDILIHLAWGGLQSYNSLNHFETELPSHYKFLKSIIDDGLNNLTVAGTCLEYGMESGRLSEEHTTTPQNPYGLSKHILRQQLEFLSKEKDFELNWLRIFYLWGEDQDENSLYPLLRKAVLQQQETFNMSGGEQLRDYLHVSQVADYIVRLALTQSGCGTVNVCSGQPVSVRRLVEDWIASNNWRIALNLGHYNYPDYEPMAFWGDNSKLCLLVSNND